MLNDRDGPSAVFPLVSAYRLDVFEAVRSLANRLLTVASVDGLTAVPGVGLDGILIQGSSEDSPEHLQYTYNYRPFGRPYRSKSCPRRALDTGVGIAGAFDILRAHSVDEAASKAQWIVRGKHPVRGQPEEVESRLDGWIAATIVLKAYGYLDGLSERPKDTIGKAISRTLGDHDELAKIDPAPRFPDIWPAWSAQFLPDFHATAALRAVLMTASNAFASNKTRVGVDLMFGGPGTADFLVQNPTRALSSERFSDRYGEPSERHRRAARDAAYWREVSDALSVMVNAADDGDASVLHHQLSILEHSLLVGKHPWDELFSGDAAIIRDDPMFRSTRLRLLERLTELPCAHAMSSLDRS
ncbi:hypothetical protein [Mycolicibacterium sp. CBMA 226]|uniref:hypothetical protein n=1 Tax=Mycolicibacterium sp. CBMA 226 TaxID=2606611 RepID=UPI001FB73D15|nr:hypothetical protein [Mycolicibacterium sp. CBMA 226]